MAIGFCLPRPGRLCHRSDRGATSPTSPRSATVWPSARFSRPASTCRCLSATTATSFAYGEATGGVLPEINKRIADLGGQKSLQESARIYLRHRPWHRWGDQRTLSLGNNSCVETFILRNKRCPDIIAEDGASIRAVIREYKEISGSEEEGFSPLRHIPDSRRHTRGF